MTAVTPGGHGVVSKFGITSNDGAEIDQLYMFYVKQRNASIGRFGGGTLAPDTVGYGAGLHALWETSTSSPTSFANGAVVLAGYAPSAAPPTMKLVFQAMGEKYPSNAPGALRPAISVEFYNWTLKQWQPHQPNHPMSAFGGVVPIPGGTLGPVTVAVSQPARFIDPAQENLMVVRIRPTQDARKCIGKLNGPPPCAPVAASVMTIFVQ